MRSRRPFDLGEPAVRLGLLAFGLVLLSGPDPALAQCALCRDALAAAPSATREAMNYAILALAFAPYGVAALAAWTLSPGVRAYVRGRLKRFSAGKSGTLP